ncbi:MAG: DUF86 domain-containing protein [Candidatus Omnitrophica bacterium]|nr:DUF86 domain-containing protein [Candidatus Omnitrophota bacterium]
MTKRTDDLYLKDIADCIEKVRVYTKALTFKDFTRNELVVDAVIRNFEIIGEASKKISTKVKSLHKEIPWQEMAGFRNKMIHEYFGVDLKIVWKTIKYSLPELKKQFELF